MRSDRRPHATIAGLVAPVVLAALALTACRSVIGGDDLTFVDGASGGAGASAGSGGSATAGASGTGGTGGGSGGSGTAGASGTGGTGGGPKFECNPVTNQGCAANEGCDFDMAGTYSCFPPPLAAPLCGACSSDMEPYCEGGTTCVGNKCFRFCCTNADCGSGECYIEPGDPTGICYAKDSTDPACDAPKVAPSGGSCAPFP